MRLLCAGLILAAACTQAEGTPDAGPGATADAGSGDVEPPPRSPGAKCDSDAECDSGTCANPGTVWGLGQGRCSRACDGASDCGGFDDGYDYVCSQLAGADKVCVRTCVWPGRGCPKATEVCLFGFQPQLGVRLNACLDLAPDVCTADRDCDAEKGEVCLYAGDAERVVNYCYQLRDASGVAYKAKRTGDPCDYRTAFQHGCAASADCPDGWSCERQSDGTGKCTTEAGKYCPMGCDPDGRCTGLCDEDADCAEQQQCFQHTYRYFPRGGADGTTNAVIGACHTAQGSGASCEAADTCPSGESCGLGRGPQEYACRTRTDQAAIEGGACGDDPATTAIEIRRCDGACLGNVCGERCRTDADCPTPLACRRFRIDAARVADFCMADQPCTSDAACGEGKACVPEMTPTAVVRRCRPANGALPPGATCKFVSTPSLLPFEQRCRFSCDDTGRGASKGRCTTVCESDGDCATDSVCSGVYALLDDRGTPAFDDDVTEVLKLCGHLPGSRTACARDADCPQGEVCNPRMSTAGGYAPRCTTPPSAAAAYGQSCTTRLCASMLCIGSLEDATKATCATLCATDADCTAPDRCRLFDNGYPPALRMKLCLPESDPRGSAP